MATLDTLASNKHEGAFINFEKNSLFHPTCSILHIYYFHEIILRHIDNHFLISHIWKICIYRHLYFWGTKFSKVDTD